MRTFNTFFITLLTILLNSCCWFGKCPPPPEPQGIIVTVKDKKGKPIKDAIVTVSAANVPDPKATDSNGEARFEGKDIGSYNVSVEHEEYEFDSKQNISVAVGKPTYVSFTLGFKSPLIFNQNLFFGNPNDVLGSVSIKNGNSKQKVSFTVTIPGKDQSWLKVNRNEMTLTTNFQDNLTFSVITQGKTNQHVSSEVILNYTTGDNQTGSSILYVSMFMPNPQAPKVTTYDVNGISQNSADVIGSIVSEGGAAILERGFYWSEAPFPSAENGKEIKKGGGKLGEFSETIENLSLGQKYYVRAFAKNSFGMGLGEVKSFTTSFAPTKPTVLLEITNIFPDKIALKGKISSNGGGNVKQCGFVWSITGEPKITDNIITVQPDANNFFAGEIIGLKPETDYKLRAYAISDIAGDNTGYSQVLSQKTLVVDKSPKISNFSPVSNTFGEKITIRGSNFGTDSTKVKVIFSNNRRAPITDIKDSELSVLVPEGAITGKISVEVVGQPKATSEANFTYILSPFVRTIKTLDTKFYVNDVTSGCNGDIFISAVNIISNGAQKPQINGSVMYRMSGDNISTIYSSNLSGNVDGSLNEARFINPTQITCVNNEIFVADQYDAGTYTANYSKGYTSIKRIANGRVNTVYTEDMTNTQFIHEMIHFPQLTGLLYTNGAYFQYSLTGKPSQILSYDGLTIAMDYAGTNLYTLDLTPSTNSAKWTLNKRENPKALAGAYDVSSNNLFKVNTYPVGMAVDPKRQYAYVVEANSKGNFTIFRINLKNETREILYDGIKSDVQTNGKIFNTNSKGAFTSISCIAFDSSRDALILIDVDPQSRNNVRLLEYR